jgi:hypothetical protein
MLRQFGLAVKNNLSLVINLVLFSKSFLNNLKRRNFIAL